MSTEPKQISPEDAQDEGVYGTLHDPIENEAYTLQGQGPETAKREREAHETLRERFLNAGKGDDDESSSSESSETGATATSSRRSRTTSSEPSSS
jgi:hypothetical protein